MTTPFFFLGKGDDWPMPITYADSTVASVTVVAGSGYTTAHATIGAPPIGGVQATLIATVISGAVHLAIGNPGSGYDHINPPSVLITGDGNGASATAVVGKPIDWTGSTIGGEMYLAGHPGAPMDLTQSNGGIVALDLPNGKVTFFVPLSVTANVTVDSPSILVPPPTPYGVSRFPNRLQLWQINSLGYRETIAVFPIYVFDPRNVDPAIFPQNQTGYVAASGLQGPAGPASTDSVLTLSATLAIGGHKVAKADSGGISPASSDSPGDYGRVIGVSIGAAAQGSQAQIQTRNIITDTSWTWSSGPIFLGLAGALTQTPPAIGIYQQVAVAMSTTSILVDIQDPILRA
jgi:hypothetical protein